MTRRYYDDCGYEIQQPWHRPGGWDDAYAMDGGANDEGWHCDYEPNDLESQYRAAGMVLHKGVWVLPHQVEDENV